MFSLFKVYGILRIYCSWSIGKDGYMVGDKVEMLVGLE